MYSHMQEEDIIYFSSGGAELKRKFKINDSFKEINFYLHYSGENYGKKDERWYEGVGIEFSANGHLKKGHSKKSLSYCFWDGLIESLSFYEELDNKDKNSGYLFEDVFTIKDNVILYEKQANFFSDDILRDYNFNNKEEGINFIDDITSICTNYANQIIEQLENSKNHDNQILLSKLETIIGADQEFHLRSWGYSLNPGFKPFKGRSMTYGGLVGKLEKLGFEDKIILKD